MNSRLEGFYKLGVAERRKMLTGLCALTGEELSLLENTGALDEPTADRMIENMVGAFPLPLGIATNFLINGKDYLIPMALEEPSVIAAASNGAKIARSGGGIKTTSTAPIMIGQIQIVGVKNLAKAKRAILKSKAKIIATANTVDPTLTKYGGGCKGLEVRELKGKRGKFLVVHLLVNVADAMGANAVNTMCEKLAPTLEEITGGKVRLRILSNLAVYRLATAKATFKKSDLGADLIEAILDAYSFADADPFRAATNNKGIMNGVDAVAIACGNDWRALEAGAHAYAVWANKGVYKPLAKYYKDKNSNLIGELTMPVAVGIVGGATKTHPLAKVCMKILGAKSARELGEVLAAVGLVQNFAALRALAGEGIQLGHMRLHARKLSQ